MENSNTVELIDIYLNMMIIIIVKTIVLFMKHALITAVITLSTAMVIMEIYAQMVGFVAIVTIYCISNYFKGITYSLYLLNVILLWSARL